MPHIYSGVCLTALFSSIIHEHRRLKREASKIKAEIQALAGGPGRAARRPLSPAESGPSIFGLA